MKVIKMDMNRIKKHIIEYIRFSISFGIVFCVSLIDIYAQVNLISNSGFEDQIIDRCSMSSGSTSLPSATQGWVVPTTSSPDIYSSTVSISCFTKIPASLHNWRIGSEASMEGTHYAGFFAYGSGSVPNYREYLQTQLIAPLVQGRKYEVSYYVSLADQSGFACNNLGVHFSTSPISGSTDGTLTSFTPQIIETNVINVSSGWVLISGSFVADDGYRYATFGNFSIDDSTTTSAFRNPTGVTGDFWYLDDAYYYIDKISVMPTIQILPINTICIGDSIDLVGLNSSIYNWYIAQDPATIISTDSILTVSPTVTTTYYLFGTNDSASITVNVSMPPTVYAGEDSTIFLGDNFILQGEIGNDVTTYYWNDNASIFNNETLLNPEVTLDNTTEFYLYGENLFGCSALDTVVINILEEEVNQCEILIPTAFTPDEDGVNDVWMISCIDNIEGGFINVFNRWGNMVYESNTGAEYIPWTGDNLPVGSYYYLIEIEDKENYKGTVSIIK